MADSKSRPKVDPELTRQLEAAGESPVSLACSLRTPGAKKFLPPDEVERVVRGLLDRVAESVGQGPEQVKVFRNLGSFVVSAAAPFVRELLKQGELATATANEQPTDLLIRPVPDRRASADEPAGQ